jgi:ATP-dependent Zn protease
MKKRIFLFSISFSLLVTIPNIDHTHLVKNSNIILSNISSARGHGHSHSHFTTSKKKDIEKETPSPVVAKRYYSSANSNNGTINNTHKRGDNYNYDSKIRFSALITIIVIIILLGFFCFLT